MKKRILILALVLFLLPAVPAAARETFSLEWRGGGNSAELVLSGLEESVYALQLELTLEGLCEDMEFLSEVREAYSPDCRVHREDGRTAVTVYMTGRSPLNDGDRLFLGTLEAKEILPAPAEALLTLLDRDLQPIQGANETLVELWGRDVGESGSLRGYRVQLEQTAHGTLRASPLWAEEDETVTLTARPDAGYALERLEVTGSDGRRLRVKELGGNRYSFTMPDGQARAVAFFVRSDGVLPELPFTDVSPEDWFYEAAGYVYTHGLMLGTTDTTFAPQITTNRGMIVTILHRLEGTPAAGQGGFLDVPAEMYCADAVAWAAANGIVNGYGNGRFGPRDTITRQQLAAILYRYAVYKGRPTGTAGDLTDYPDGGSVSPYAREAMEWAVGNVLLLGDEAGLLMPQSGATRAQAAFALTGLCLDLAEESE